MGERLGMISYGHEINDFSNSIRQTLHSAITFPILKVSCFVKTEQSRCRIKSAVQEPAKAVPGRTSASS